MNGEEDADKINAQAETSGGEDGQESEESRPGQGLGETVTEEAAGQAATPHLAERQTRRGGSELAGDLGQKEKGDEESQQAQTAHGEKGNVHTVIPGDDTAEQGAKTKTAEEGGVGITHPFTFFAFRGDVTDVRLGDGQNQTAGNPVCETHHRQLDNGIRPDEAGGDNGV